MPDEIKVCLRMGRRATSPSGSQFGSCSRESGSVHSHSISPKEFHIVGLDLMIDRHDGDPLDHGLTDDQAVKRIFVVMREVRAGNGY